MFRQTFTLFSVKIYIIANDSFREKKNYVFLTIKFKWFWGKFKPLMNILESVFFETDDKYLFKAKNSCCVQEIFSLRNYNQK